MIRIELSATDMGRIRFASAPAPILEGAMALFELRAAAGRPAMRSRRDWQTRIRATFPAAARPLGELFTPLRAAYLFDVLTSDSHVGFDVIAATPTAQLTRDVRWLQSGGVAGRSTWLRDLALGTADARHVLDQALRAYHHRCIAPLSSYVANTFHDDLTRRAATMQSQGVLAMLNGISPDMRVSGHVLHLRSRSDIDVPSAGNGLILMPSAFWTGQPMLTHDRQNPADRILIYPASPPHARSAADTQRHGDPLASLLGATRAKVFRALILPLTTHGIADRLRISNASASQHAAALREAGLICSVRDGRTVVHSLTTIGAGLLAQQPLRQ
jgi:DNA-binding transcriptional ArsR family regulator